MCRAVCSRLVDSWIGLGRGVWRLGNKSSGVEEGECSRLAAGGQKGVSRRCWEKVASLVVCRWFRESCALVKGKRILGCQRLRSKHEGREAERNAAASDGRASREGRCTVRPPARPPPLPPWRRERASPDRVPLYGVRAPYQHSREKKTTT